MENQDRLEPGRETRIGNLSIHRNWESRLFIVAVSSLSEAQKFVLDKLFLHLPKTANQANPAWVFHPSGLNEREAEARVAVLGAVLKAVAASSVPAPGNC